MFYNNSKYKKHTKSSRRCVFLLLLLFIHAANAFAQHDTIKEKKYSIEFQIFANTNFNNETSEQLKFEYALKRTLIVYKQYLSPNFTLCLAGDSYAKNSEEPFNLTPYLKRAYLQYHKQGFSITAGLLVSEQFKYQRKIWQLRYIDKTFQNQFNYGENRNIGVLIKHNLSKYFSYDIAITSGYYTPISKSSKKYQLMAGQTFHTNFCSLRLFNSISLKPNLEHIISLFITKKLRNSNLGIEVAKKSSNNKLVDENQYGFSVFGNHEIYKNIMCFARYDINKESITPQTENVIWAGIQYSFKKNINASIYYKSEGFKTNFYGLTIFIH